MIVLDTNVISEAMKPEASDAVKVWLDAQPAAFLYLTTVTQAELLFGIARLPTGQKKDRLASALAGIERLFVGRVLPFDTSAAIAYAKLAALARASGRGFPTPDGYIAAIAVSRGFTVATRDTAPFAAANVETINPWSYAP
jgi:predicted nucleic acid-binding protein